MKRHHSKYFTVIIMSSKISLLIITVLIAAASTLGQERVNIAVMDLESQGVPETEAQILTERVRFELYQTGKFTVLERSNMVEILKEQAFEQSGCTGDECIILAGRILSMQQMVTGTVSKLGRIYTITLRMIDVESGEIVAMSSVDIEGSIEDVLTKSVKEAVSKLIGESVQTESRTTADIYATSNPTGAIIYLDGVELEGMTPAIFEGLQPGEHEIRIVKGNMEGKQTVNLDPGDIKRVDLKLEPMVGDLKILSDPFDADVWMLGIFKGKTPILISNISAGHVELTLKKEGYKDFVKSIEVKPKQVNRYEFTLEKLPVEKPVIQTQIQPPLIEVKEKKSHTWLYVAGAAVIAGGVTYFLMSQEKEQQPSQGTLIIKVPVNP